jgi:hypothetical protein
VCASGEMQVEKKENKPLISFYFFLSFCSGGFIVAPIRPPIKQTHPQKQTTVIIITNVIIQTNKTPPQSPINIALISLKTMILKPSYQLTDSFF